MITRRWYIYLLLVFFLGLMAGSIAVYKMTETKVHRTRIAFQLYKEVSDALWDTQASRAYYSGNRPAAIYLLSEHLLTLQKRAEHTSPYETGVGMVITHGRLAKLYGEAGDTDQKSKHVAEAIEWSKKTHRTFANEIELSNHIASLDKIFGHEAK